jgi:hypothetical protein
MIFGLLGFVFGSYVSILNIIQPQTEWEALFLGYFISKLWCFWKHSNVQVYATEI